VQAYWAERKTVLGISADMDMPMQLAAVAEARALVRDQAPTRTVAQGAAGVERDDRMLGDLAGEAVAQAQAEAQTVWVGVQDLADAWQLGRLGQQRMQETRSEAQDVWREAQGEERLRDAGRDAIEDAWRDAVLLWAEEQGARALREAGWETVHEAWEAGQEGLAVEAQKERLLEQTQRWQSLEDSLQDLARHLDALSEEDGSSGHVRIRLWEREQGIGL
jgi:hypothetical protein